MDITAAVVHEKAGKFALENVSLEDPGPDEVIVEISGVGLCHTDLAVRDGVVPYPMPGVLGHEASGTIVQAGREVTKVAVGDRVAISFDSCGQCSACSTGVPAYCAEFMLLNFSGGRRDGSSALSSTSGSTGGHFFGQSSFASHCIARDRNVVKVGDDIPLELAGTLGCGVQTGAGAVMRSLRCSQGSSLLVLGAGPVGLSAVMGGAVQGCDPIIVVEPHASRRELAHSLGAGHALDPSDPAMGDRPIAEALPEQLRGIVPAGMDYAIDTTARKDVLEATLQCMGQRGTLGMVGIPSDALEALPVNLIQTMIQGLTVTGIVEGDSDPDVFIPELLELYRQGRFPFDKMITRMPLSEINDAIEAQHRGEATKVVLTNG